MLQTCLVFIDSIFVNEKSQRVSFGYTYQKVSYVEYILGWSSTDKRYFYFHGQIVLCVVYIFINVYCSVRMYLLLYPHSLNIAVLKFQVGQ